MTRPKKWSQKAVACEKIVGFQSPTEQRSSKLISMILYHDIILYQFLGIFDIIISLFWAVILGDIISK
jgi:hypothetical protein